MRKVLSSVFIFAALFFMSCTNNPSGSISMHTPNVLAPYGTNATDNSKQSYHYVIELDGPTSVTLEVDSGEEVFIDGLIAGDYIVSCKAFIDDEVRFFGQTKATVEIGKTKSVPLKLEIHNHVGNGKYFSDENNHWELCECGKVVNKADHSGDWVITDSDLHWKECRCGKKFDESNHDWNVTVQKKPTTTATGVKTYTCTVCEYTKTETLPKIDYSTCVVGDIILKDGSICKVDDYDSSTNSAAAVIVRAASGTTPALGVGLKQGSGAWCLQSAAGYNTSVALLANIEDGSSGWTILKTSCSDAANNPGNYPAWNFSLTYASQNGLTGDLENGWYLPTESELQTIFKNKSTVNENLAKVGGAILKTSSQYWASNQGSSNSYAYSFDFSYGTSYDSSAYKYYERNICSVRAFK